MARFIGKLLIWVIGTLALSAALLFALCQIDAGELTVMERLLGHSVRPGGRGYTMLRFREAEKKGPVDIVFIGSSHAYLSLNPRVYAPAGLTGFNLGSNSQSPLVSFFLLKRYLPLLKPRIVVFEAYFRVFETDDGLEGFYELAYNLTPSREIFGMALAGRNPTAITTAAAQLFLQRRRPLSSVEQTHEPNMKYVGDGFCETYTDSAERKYVGKKKKLSPRQEDYFRRALRLTKASGAVPVVVVQPISERMRDGIPWYREMSDRIGEIARQESALYMDYNGVLKLDEAGDFADTSHLNARGAKRFSEEVLKLLIGAGLAPV